MQSRWQSRCTGYIAPLLGAMAFFMLNTPTHADVKMESVTYKGWNNSYRISNGTVELVVVPSVCRIMHYGFTGGPNMLWENTPLLGTMDDGKLGTNWRNVGGDKVWPWPQDDWGKLLPQAWPPPAAADSLPFHAEVVDKGILRISSLPIAPWGVQIVRDIRLEPTGTVVHVTSKLWRNGEGVASPCAPWTITQVPANSWVMARPLPTTKLPEKFKGMSGNAHFKSVTSTSEGMALVERNPQQATKIGIEADLVATLEGDTLFTVRFAPTTPADNDGHSYVAGDQAQFYSQPDDAAAAKMGTLPYIEMEMTAPLKTLKVGETNTLSLLWELHRLPVAKRNPAGVAEVLKKR